MSRLHLSFLCLFVSLTGITQVKTKQLVSFADEQFKKGDYYYALTYYKKAIAQDSNSLELQWKLAETQRSYKDYVEAEKCYSKVYARDVEGKYPLSLLYLGLMQKQNGNYSRAFETFKLAKKKFESEKSEYLYKKANQEVEATAWAIKNYVDTTQPLKKLPLTVNSYDAEFGHTIRDNRLIFSSLRADSTLDKNQEVYTKEYKTHLFVAGITPDGYSKNNTLEDLFYKKLSTGNGTYSLDGKRFYFSLCEDENYNYKCKIMVANYENGRWMKVDSLTSNINAIGANTTMPYVTKLEGKEVLFFVSDREGTKGGLDIWYAPFSKDGKFEKAVNVEINTIDNDLTPWYDSTENKLYFSTTWHYGFGGQDIFSSALKNGRFTTPLNIGLPYNSPANDLYYFKHNDTVYVSSNRIGSYYSKNPTCCTDIYAYYPPIKPPKPVEKEIAKVEEPVKHVDTDYQKEIKRRLPLTLYFRNDEPDASSYATSTKQNYINTYKLYVERYPLYKSEVMKGLVPELGTKKQMDLEDFFKNNVDKGANDLLMLTEMIKKELQNGSAVTLSIKGFASPVAKTDYNVNLTKRRISSLINFFNEYNSGELKEYVAGSATNGGKLIFIFAPFGEYVANQQTSDNIKDQSNSVYSKEAGIERKIQIENISFDKNEKIFPFQSPSPVFTAGEVKKGKVISGSFSINNITTEDATFELENNNPDLQLVVKSATIGTFGKAIIQFTLKTDALDGLTDKFFKLKVNGFEDVNLEFHITTEVK